MRNGNPSRRKAIRDKHAVPKAEANLNDYAEAKPKHAGGRPSKFKPQFIIEAEKLCCLGATDEDLADFFDVDIRTIYRWATQHEEFCHALRAGKEKADDRVERSLYQRAVGYTHDAVKIFMPAGASGPVYAPYREHVPPDGASAMFWLKNRRKDDWRDVSRQEQTGADGGPIQHAVTTIERIVTDPKAGA